MDRLLLSDVAAAKGEMIVSGVEATITSVGNQNSGTGQYGPWTLQDVGLEDGGTKFIAVFANRPKLGNQAIGQRAVFECVQGNKGLSGVKVKSRKKNGGGTEMVLYVNNMAAVGINGKTQEDAAPAATDAPKPGPASPPAPSARPTQARREQPMPQPEQPKKSPLEEVRAAWTCLERFGNFYGLALRQGHIQRMEYDKEHPERPMTDEQFQAMVSSLVITADRHGASHSMPVGDISQYLTQL